jgi:superfamily II DNA or RNA helicase
LIVPPSQEQLLALDAVLDEFDDLSSGRGERYLAEGRVGSILWDPAAQGFRTTVRGSEVYTVSWKWTGAFWKHECTCPVGVWCKHSFAAAAKARTQFGDAPAVSVSPAASLPAAALQEKKRTPAPGAAAPDVPPAAAQFDAFIAQLEAAHGRKLRVAEKSVVKRLARLHASFEQFGFLDAYALGEFARSVQPGIGFSAFVAPEVIGEIFDDDDPPATLAEFWQHVAAMFRVRRWSIPELLAPITDTRAIDERVAARRQQRELAAWTQRLADLEPTVPVAPMKERRQLRVMIGPKAIVFQSTDATGAWNNVPIERLREFARPAGLSAAADVWDMPSVVLLSFFEENARYGWHKSPQLRDPSTRLSLARALAHPDTRNRVVNAAGAAYSWSPDRLTWRFTADAENAGQVILEFGREGGGALPQPLMYLGGPPHLYVSPAEVFTGPAPLADRPDVGWKVVLPAAVLAQERVLRALVQAKAELPPAIAARVEHVKLRPLLRVDLASGQLAGEVVRVIFTAVDAAGQRRLTYTPTGWTEDFEEAPRPSQNGPVVVPDTTALTPALEQFRTLHWDWIGSPARWARGVHENTPVELAAWFAGFPPDTIFEIAPELAALRAAPVRAEFALSIEESGRDWFDVELVVRAADTELMPAELELLLKAQGRWVRLEGKGWRRLALAADAQQQARLAELGLASEGVLPGKQRFHALQLAAANLEEIAAERAWRTVQERARAITALPAPPTPPGLLAELRHYQQDGFHFLAHLAANSLGGILADDMGLGKTVQALAWLLWLSDHAPADRPLRALVVCPKSVVTNWEREAARFTPSLRVGIFRPKPTYALPANVPVVVANYAQLRSCESLFLLEQWSAVILDEGQNIKNPQSQTADVARKLRVEHRLVLTGTPIENRVLDLWSLFAFAMPGLLGGQTQFKKLYDDRKDPTARTRLARRVRHFLLRRTKGQVATELPPRIEEDVICELEGDQKKLYDAELKRARQLVLGVKDQRGFDAARFNILQSLLRLRQICCHPALLGDEFARSPSAKVAAFFDQLEPILDEGHKVLVFSQFVSVLEILQRELTAREIAFLTITGATENRQELVDEFQISLDVRVFLLSLKAAGAGLNLTAASYVILFDPWWNPAVEAQAIDRTHRIGQTNQVISRKTPWRKRSGNCSGKKPRSLEPSSRRKASRAS